MSASPERQAYIREYQTRTHRVSLTLSASEYRELARRAKVEGVRVTTLVKNMALAYHQGTVIQPEAVTHELQELRALLRNIANNVNQMAHTSHIIGHMVDERGFLDEIRKLEEAVFEHTGNRLRGKNKKEP